MRAAVYIAQVIGVAHLWFLYVENVAAAARLPALR